MKRKLDISGARDKREKKKSRKIFPYGNMDRYYGYRSVDNPKEVDKRIEILMKYKSNIEDRNCLDVGCNCGKLTFQIAKYLKCKKILGIDIDDSLIQKANMIKENLIKKNSSVQSKGGYPENVFFKTENFVESPVHDEKYDVIFFMSVAKWIHLNYGDEGLQKVFKKIYDSLTPNGVFIMEPQPWKSYKKRRNLTEVIAKNYKNIKLRPSEFSNYLLNQVGFSRVIKNEQKKEKESGFAKRDIFVFFKS